MSTLATLLMSLVGPMVLRALTVLGIGLVTFTGVTAGLNSIIQMVQDNWSNLPAALLALASLAGVPQAMGLIAGAMVARVATWAAISATKWIVSA